MALDPKDVTAALEAVTADDGEKCKEVLMRILAAAAGGAPAPAEEDPKKPKGDKAEPAAGAPPPPAAAAAEKPEEVAAATALFMRMSGKSSIVDAIKEAEVWRKSHITHETDVQALAKERATLELAERRKLCVELVHLGAEFPATVWSDDTATALKPRWLKMEIQELREHTLSQRAARGGKAPPEPVAPPAGGDAPKAGEQEITTPYGVVKLSAREVAMCDELKQDPKDYAARKAQAAKNKKG